jgi:solute carrier family 25 phosphate transporter 23/24/25/41
VTHNLTEAQKKLHKLDSQISQKREEVVSKILDATKEVVVVDPKLGPRRQSVIDDKALKEVAATIEQVKQLEAEKKALWSQIDVQALLFSKTFKQLLCGGAAGTIARTTVAPVDRVKILMQTAHVQKKTHLYGTMGQTIRQILRDDGIVGLWRGNLTNCVRVAPHAAVQFVTYDKIKVALIGSSDGKMSVPERLLAGSLSGIAAASATQPLDVVRIRLQTDPDVKGKVSIAVRAMWNEGGVRTFYKGWTPAMLSLAPFIAVNFATFDSLKSWWYGDGKCTKEELKARNPLVVLSLGALSGIVAQTICYPLDTVRRRMQMKGKVYPNTPMAFVTIAREEGIRGFYRGIAPNALKVMPNNAIRFAAYETLKNWFVEE